MPAVQILDASGQPMRRRASTSGGPAYNTGDPMASDLAAWAPRLASPDATWLHQRDGAVARGRDLVRTNAWASGAVRREVDTVIGSKFRLSAKPDWRALGLTADWAAGFARDAEALWRSWALDPGRYGDAARQLTVPQLFAQAYRHYAVDGDAIGLMLWRPGRGGPWATCLQVVHPSLLSNPHNGMNTATLRAGIRLGPDGEAIAYHFRRAHADEWWPGQGADSWTWDEVARETEWGRPLVIHHFDKDEAGQHRGVPRLAAILEPMKMGDKYDQVELQAAVLNAVLAAFIESPMDPALMADALDDGKLTSFQEMRVESHTSMPVTLAGVRIPILPPGDKLAFQQAVRPAAQYADFQSAVLRKLAAGMGLSYEQLSGDWSRVNYSSARAALIEVWRSLTARRETFAQGFCTPVYAAWLEEALDRGDLELPPGAPPFELARGAYAHCRWIGPGKGWVDPLKEKQAAVLAMASGMDTLENVCAEQGLDYEEVLAQLAREIADMPPGVLHPAQKEWAQLLGAASTQPDATEERTR